MYLLDANVLISADALFYPMDRIPQFWEWLLDRGKNGDLKIPAEIHHEIASGSDRLADWVSELDTKDALLLQEEPQQALVWSAMEVGYQANAPEFNDSELQKIGRDAFLVAYGLADPTRTITTREVPKPSKRLGGRKLPDACDDCRVQWTSDYEMYRLLDFNLSGRRL